MTLYEGEENWLILLPEKSVDAAIAALAKARIRYFLTEGGSSADSGNLPLIEISKKYSKEAIIAALSQK